MSNIINIEDRYMDPKTRAADEAAYRFYEAKAAFDLVGGYWATTDGQKDYARQLKEQEAFLDREQIKRENELSARKKEVDKAIKSFNNKPTPPDHFLNNKHLTEKSKKVGIYLSSIPPDFQFRPDDVNSALGVGKSSWKNVAFQLKTEGYLKLFPHTIGRRYGYRFDFNRFES